MGATEKIPTTLLEVVRQLDRFPDRYGIYAIQTKGQWTGTSQASLVELDDDGRPLQKPEGMKSVLPVFLAKEVISDWKKATGKIYLSPEEKLDIILHYAEYDAPPPITDSPFAWK